MRWLERWRTPAATVADRIASMAAAHDAASLGNYQKALEIYGPLARAGVPRAQNNVRACFAEGLGVNCDQALAVRWLSLAEVGDGSASASSRRRISRARRSRSIAHAWQRSIGLPLRLATDRQRTC